MNLAQHIQSAIEGIANGVSNAKATLKENGGFMVSGDYGDSGINVHFKMDPAAFDGTPVATSGSTIEFDVYIDPRPPAKQPEAYRIPLEDEEEDE